MPTPRPTSPATGMAETDTSIEPASRVMPPMPAPTATIERPIGMTAATTVPNTTSRTSSATRRPMPVWLEVFVLGVQEHGVAAELDAEARHVRCRRRRRRAR